MTEWIKLDQEARVAGIMPAGEKLWGKTPDYETMCDEARELSDNGLASAYFVPATRFMVDASLGILAQPQVDAQLPTEVNSRVRIAVDVVRDVVRVGVDKRFFFDAYVARESLGQAQVAPQEVVALEEEEYLSSIGMAPFFDVGVVAGGGLHLLQEHDLAKDAPAILQRSLGLLAVARLRKDETTTAFTYLGLPYVDSRFLRLENADDPASTEVNFTDEAHSYLKSLYGRGCPTGRMASDEAHNLLTEYWRKTIAYLVPDNATVEAYQPQPFDLEV